MPWNKGLKAETDIRVKRNIDNAVKTMKAKGIYKLHSIRMTGKKHSMATRLKMSISSKKRVVWNKGIKGYTTSCRGRKNPILSKRLIEKFKLFPEKHLNRILASKQKEFGKGRISKGQMELFNLIKLRYADAELNYPLLTNLGMNYLDVGIPSLKLNVEYDGIYWHDSSKDNIRDTAIKLMGWDVVRIKEGENIRDRVNSLIENQEMMNQ